MTALPMRRLLFAAKGSLRHRDSAPDFGAKDRMETSFSFSFFTIWIPICSDGSKCTRRKDAFEYVSDETMPGLYGRGY